MATRGRRQPAKQVIYFALSDKRASESAARGSLCQIADSEHLTQRIEVALNKLSLAARLVAMGIYTTDLTGKMKSLAHVRLRSHDPLRLLVQEGCPPHTYPDANTEIILDQIEAEEPVPEQVLDQHPGLIWLWEKLPPGESPESFLERQVRGMLDAGRIEHLPLLAQTRFTTRSAAQLLGVSPGRVRQMIGRGQIQAQKEGRDWLICPWDLIPVADRKPGYPAGRPRRKKDSPNSLGDSAT